MCSVSVMSEIKQNKHLLFSLPLCFCCVCVYMCVCWAWPPETFLPGWSPHHLHKFNPLFLYLWIKDHFHFSHSPRLFSCYCGNNTMVNSVYFLLAMSSSVSSSPLFLDSCHHLHPHIHFPHSQTSTRPAPFPLAVETVLGLWLSLHFEYTYLQHNKNDLNSHSV